MADSDLICTSLAATSGVGQAILTWEIVDPLPGGPPYLVYDKTEVWAAATNDRALAAKVGEGRSSFTHGGVTPGATMFYWVRPLNAAGVPGEFFPASTTAGVASTAGTSQPGPGSITAVELAPGAVTDPALADDAVPERALQDLSVTRAKLGFASVGSLQVEYAAITDAHIVSLNAGKIVATSLSAISADLGTVTAGTIYGVVINGGTINGISVNGGTMTGVDVYGSFHTGTSWPVVNMGSLGISVEDSSGSARVQLNTSSSASGIAVNTYTPSQFAMRVTNGAAGAIQGTSPTYAFYASGGGGYGPFTAVHPVLWPIDEPLPEIGDLVMDDGVLFRNGVSNTLCLGKLSQHKRPALGAFATELQWGREAAMPDDMSDEQVEHLGTLYRLILVNALGEGQVNCCDEGGPIEAGDLLVASIIAGKAMKQADDCMRASTVARSREDVVFDGEGRALVACIYQSG